MNRNLWKFTAIIQLAWLIGVVFGYLIGVLGWFGSGWLDWLELSLFISGCLVCGWGLFVCTGLLDD